MDGLVTMVFTFHDGVFAISMLLSSVLAGILTLFFFKKLPKDRRVASVVMTFVGSILLLHFGLSHLISVKALDVEVIRLKKTLDDGKVSLPNEKR
ncbi:MAG: hypothetical protein GY822_25200 [Deltaproteobacteria bacterium]|nr:hypothetical protein [Deltaproteobacteria bacterium]